jgi:hypothetical protein
MPCLYHANLCPRNPVRPKSTHAILRLPALASDLVGARERPQDVRDPARNEAESHLESSSASTQCSLLKLKQLTGPNVFESRVRYDESPSIHTCPGGTLMGAGDFGGSGVTISPASATTRLVVSSSGLLADLGVGVSRGRIRGKEVQEPTRAEQHRRGARATPTY